jgi:hypothetical protein
LVEVVHYDNALVIAVGLPDHFLHYNGRVAIVDEPASEFRTKQRYVYLGYTYECPLDFLEVHDCLFKALEATPHVSLDLFVVV